MADLSRNRHHTERIRHKRKRYFVTGFREERDTRFFRVRFIECPKPCSCWMCGNPRKWNNDETLQERRYSLRFELGLTDSV